MVEDTKLELPRSLYFCPEFWKNFIDDNDISGNESLNAELVKWNATAVYHPEGQMTIKFASNADYIHFMLMQS